LVYACGPASSTDEGGTPPTAFPLELTVVIVVVAVLAVGAVGILLHRRKRGKH